MHRKHNRVARLAAVIVLLAAQPVLGRAQESPDPSGHWEGAVELPTMALDVSINLDQAGGAWTGDITIPRQQAFGLELVDVTVDGRAVAFTISGVPGDPTFQGTLSEDGTRIEGDFTQAGQTFPFALERVDAKAEVAAALEGFYDEWLSDAMSDWRVPGMAIGIVKDGRVVFSEGYGWRDVANQKPVTTETLFAIGSATKAFTSFVMGKLVAAGKLDWDQPVIDYLPGFRLWDEYVTLHLTPLDMLTHRSGLPRHDMSWYNSSSYVGGAVVTRLAALEPSAELREEFQYNNMMYALAGQLAARLTDRSWQENVREMVFQPLGMESSNFSVDVSRGTDNYALPYVEDEDTLRLVDFRGLSNAIAPAGAINSNIEDMTRWLLLQLGNGSVAGERIIPEATLNFMHTPQMVISAVPSEPELSSVSYALGWFTGEYRGHYSVWHGGNIDGFSALVSLFPHDGLGIVVLTNRNGTPLPTFAVRNLADRIFGLDVIDWSGQALERREAAEEAAEESDERTAAVRVEDTESSHSLDAYTGEFVNAGYGILEITREDDHLIMEYNDIVARLEHWHYDVFNGLKNPEDPAFRDMKVQFRMNVEGEINSVLVPFEATVDRIVFTRAPDDRLSDPDYLARFAGEYQLGPRVVTVSLNRSTLTLTIPGQPSYTLVPGVDNEFAIEELEGFSVQFTMDDEGRVTEIVFIQPNGRFPAKRIGG